MAGNVLLQYDSWSSLLADAATTPKCLNPRSRQFDRAYFGTANFSEALDLATNGWPEGTEQAARYAQPLMDKIASQIMRDEYRYDVTGITFDVDRVLQNEPESWINYDQVVSDAPGKIIRIVFNVSSSGIISNDAIVARGAVVSALVMLLERSGYRVAVDMVKANTMRDGALCEIFCPIKTPNQDLDLSRMIFALAHPSMNRRIAFSVVENNQLLRRMPGYGGPGECPTERRGDIYIGRENAGEVQWANKYSAERWIVGQLEQQGIKLEKEEQSYVAPSEPYVYVAPPPPSPEEQKRLDAEWEAACERWEKEQEQKRVAALSPDSL